MTYAKKQAIDKFQLVTDKIVALMERGVKIWQKPWSATPYGNLITGHRYQGINPLLCAIDVTLNDWEQPFFIGFAQAVEKGWKIKKGSKSTWLRWGGTITQEIEGEDGETKKSFKNAAKWHNVFNVACLDDSEGAEKITDYLINFSSLSQNTEPRLENAEALIAAQRANVSFGGDVACYIPGSDRLRMPKYECFSSASGYYATFIHELTHWTGHHSRLNRSQSGQFGSKSYAEEELIAELGAAMICNELNINTELENHASYLHHWLEILREDNRAFFKAANHAKKAAGWLLATANRSTIEAA